MDLGAERIQAKSAGAITPGKSEARSFGRHEAQAPA